MSDNFKTLAKDFVDKDQLFQDKLREAILNKQLKKTLVLCSNKALWWQKNKGGLDALETMEFAFEIFRYVFNQMDISPKMKKKMASTVKKKLISVGKKRLKEEGDGKSPKPEKGSVLSKGKPKKPETKRKESGKSEPSESKKPKIFGSSVLPGEEKEGETQKELGEKEAKDSQSSSDSGSQTTSTSESRPISEEEKLRRQRERLRKQRMEKRKKRTAQKEEEEEESEVEDEGERTSATFNPLDRIKQWLRSDEDFWYVVERVRRLPKRTIKIMLDPDTEGIISEIELKYGVKKFGQHNIIRIRCTADSGTKYPYNLAMGKVKTGLIKKEYVTTSFPEKIPKSTKKIMEKLENVNFKNQLEWDRLMVMLNNNDLVKKSMKKLQTKNPAPGVKEEILVPIKIKQGIPNTKIILDTFLSLKVDPWTVFVDIMDEIAENLFTLREDTSGGGGLSSSLSNRFDSMATKKKDMRGHRFHYLDNDSTVSVKTCPHCGKPFPNPDADYRRCPHCLGKLK